MSSRSSASTAGTSYTNAYRRNAYEALTGESPPSVLTQPRRSRPSGGHRAPSSSKHRSIHPDDADNIHPDDSASMIGTREMQKSLPSRHASLRDGGSRVSSNHKAPNTSSHRPASSRSRKGSHTSSRSRAYDENNEEDYAPLLFHHNDSVTGLPHSRRNTYHYADEDELSNHMRKLDFDSDSDPETPTQKSFAPSMVRSGPRSQLSSTSSPRSRSNAHSAAGSRAYPPSSFRDVSRSYQQEPEDSSDEERYSRSGSSKYGGSSRSSRVSSASYRSKPAYDTPPPEYHSQHSRHPSSSHHDQDYDPMPPRRTTSTSTRRHRAVSVNDEGLMLGRGDNGRLQWERPRRGGDGRRPSGAAQKDVPKWLVWLAGGT